MAIRFPSKQESTYLLHAVLLLRAVIRRAEADRHQSDCEIARSGWSLLGFHIGVGFHIGAYQASIVLPIQAVYLETSDSHFQMSKWSSDNV